MAPWTFYVGLICFTVALVMVAYLDETREFGEEGRESEREPG